MKNDVELIIKKDITINIQKPTLGRDLIDFYLFSQLPYYLRFRHPPYRIISAPARCKHFLKHKGEPEYS